nr:TetR-like C-terminal domain-containing protein [Gracilibacillus alcaliphilus]
MGNYRTQLNFNRNLKIHRFTCRLLQNTIRQKWRCLLLQKNNGCLHLFLQNGLKKMEFSYALDFIDKEYTDQFIISGIVNTILYWLENDTDATYEDIALFIQKTRMIAPFDLMGIK